MFCVAGEVHSYQGDAGKGWGVIHELRSMFNIKPHYRPSWTGGLWYLTNSHSCLRKTLANRQRSAPKRVALCLLGAK